MKNTRKPTSTYIRNQFKITTVLEGSHINQHIRGDYGANIMWSFIYFDVYTNKESDTYNLVPEE